MKHTKKRWAPFILVLPMMACEPPMSVNPPPVPSTRPSPQSTSTATPKVEVLPTSSFPKREKGADGKCYVRVGGNPPTQEEVSCTEVPKPHNNGGCLLDMTRSPEFKVVIDCNT